MPNPAPSGPMQLPATWNASAAGYAEYMVTHAAMYAERALEIVSLRPTDSVLEVAAGPASLVFVAAPRVARVGAIDFADGMVEQIRTRAKHDGVSNVEAMIMDAQSLDFPEGSFDAAFCMFGFRALPGAQEKARRRSMGASRSATSRRCAPPRPRAGRRSRGRGYSHRGHPLTARSRLVLTRR